MNQEQIIQMAQEAGMFYRQLEDEFANGNTDGVDLKTMQAFAKLVSEHEREECIKIVESEAMQYAEPVWAFEIVNDIKARGEQA